MESQRRFIISLLNVSLFPFEIAVPHLRVAVRAGGFAGLFSTTQGVNTVYTGPVGFIGLVPDQGCPGQPWDSAFVSLSSWMSHTFFLAAIS